MMHLTSHNSVIPTEPWQYLVTASMHTINYALNILQSAELKTMACHRSLSNYNRCTKSN